MTTRAAGGPEQRSVGFSLFFFSSNAAEGGDDKYRMVMGAARYADRNGFEAVWVPERHFHAFGPVSQFERAQRGPGHGDPADPPPGGKRRVAAQQPDPGGRRVGDGVAEARETVYHPFIEYIRTSVELWGQYWKQLQELPEKDQQEMLNVAFERYFQASALFGSPETCSEMVAKLAAVGVDEIACLIDFGVEFDATMRGLERLSELKRRWTPTELVSSVGPEAVRSGRV